MIKYDVPLSLGENDNLYKLVKRIRPNSTILEFGPSTGRLTKYMNSVLECKVYGVEIDSNAFSVCSEFLENGLCGDIEDYEWINKFSDIKFDFIIFADVLEHLRNPEEVIDSVKKLMKNEAEILVSIPNIAHNAVIIELMKNRFDYNDTGLLDNTHIHFFTRDTCLELFESKGFYMTSSDGTIAEPYDTEINNSLEVFPDEVKDYLSNREFANLYQMIFSFKQFPDKREDKLECYRYREHFSKIYFDTGNGFSEENFLLEKVRLDSCVTVSIKLNEISNQIKRVAIKPIDNARYICKFNKISANGEVINLKLDADVLDYNGYSIMKEEKVIVDIEKDLREVSLEFEAKLITYAQLLDSYASGIDFLKNTVHEIDLEKNALACIIEQKTKNLENAYEKELELKRTLIQNSLVYAYKESEYKSCILTGTFKNAYLNKVYRFVRKIDHDILKTQIKYVEINCIDSIPISDSRCLVSRDIPISESDYTFFRFNNAQPTDFCLKEMINSLQKAYSDIIFSDCEIGHTTICKTDYSYEYMIQQYQEFDILLVNSRIVEIAANLYNLDKVLDSHQLMLILTQITENITHIANSLYTIENENVSIASELTQCLINDNCSLRYGKNYIGFEIMDDRRIKLNFDILSKHPKVSIIIPMKDKAPLSDECVQSIINKSTYDNYEILILDNNSEEDNTFAWFEKMQYITNVKILKADFEFNWSKLNNFGIANSDAEVFIFLNNDTIVITPDWIERLAEDALRMDTGIVGSLLLYDDLTIQHCGVVIGMNDFADHIYKQESLDYPNKNFVSPIDKRNVMAVTGACMAVSKSTLKKIGNFNETFIICGSDVEICIRTYKHGLRNIYDPYVRLFHLESKSRDSYIPPIDFEMSIQHYAPYREIGDPYFNPNLSTKQTTPTLKRMKRK